LKYLEMQMPVKILLHYPFGMLIMIKKKLSQILFLLEDGLHQF
jgi:hypothetical protein